MLNRFFKRMFGFKNVLCDLKMLKGKSYLNSSSEIETLFSTCKINGKLCFVTEEGVCFKECFFTKHFQRQFALF